MNTKIRKNLAKLILSATLLSSVAGGTLSAMAAGATASDYVNFRTGPGTDYSVEFVVSPGTTVNIVSEMGTWSKVEISGKTGYIATEYLTKETANTSPILAVTTPTPNPLPPTGNTGDKYTLTDSVKTYMSAGDAAKGVNPAGTYPAGSFYIYKTYSGMLNISRNQGVPGGWINPADNPAIAEPPVITEPPVTTGPKIAVVVSVKAYNTAANAAAGTNSTTTYSVGEYFIYKTYNGMVNISRTAGSPGAWINPADNVVKTEPPVITEPPVTTESKIAVVVSVKAYNSAANAAAGTNSTAVYPIGEYFIYKTYNGMINISRTAGSPGGWINPADNVIKADPPVITEPPAVTEETIRLVVDVDAYGTAADAAAGTNPTTVFSAGEYFIYEISNGMTNISETKGTKGSWINPLDNRIPEVVDNATPGYENLSYTMIGELRTNAPVALRKDPSDTSPLLVQKIPSGSIFADIDATDTWYKISYKDTAGVTFEGWIKKTEADIIKFYQFPAIPTGSKELVVYLDPGHREIGTGAGSTFDGIRYDEVTINWNVSLKAKELLEAKGYTVYLSKDHIADNFDLYDRITEANQLEADVYVSIHCNASLSSSDRGAIALYSTEKLNPATTDWLNSSILLSQYLAEGMAKVMGSGFIVDDVPYTDGSLAVNRMSDMPSSLLELGFLTNKADSIILANTVNQDELARQIADGIDRYFGY